MKKTIRLMASAILVGLLISPQVMWAAASGNYTDLLPIGAAGNTTVISNGSGWSLTTLPPTQTFGDSLSRVTDTVYQSTNIISVANSAAVSTFTAISGQGKVGSTTFPATWVASGRSMRINARGVLSTAAGTRSWTWGLNLGTTTVITSSAPVPASISSQAFTMSGLITINATGNAGTVMANYDIFLTTSQPGIGVPNVSNTVSYSTGTSGVVTVDLTSQLTVNPTFKWGAAAAGDAIQFNSVNVEFLN